MNNTKGLIGVGIVILGIFGISKLVKAAPISPPDGGPTNGTLIITSTPSGATVYIGSTSMGITPINTGENIKPGDYLVRFELSGYQSASKPATITAGHTTSVIATLIPNVIPPPADGVIVFQTSPAGISLYIDDVYVGIINAGNSVGVPHDVTYNIRLTLAGYQDYTTQIIVGSGQTKTVTATLIPNIPPPPEIIFRVDQIIASGYISWTPSTWRAVRFNAMVHNDSAQEATHQLSLWKSYGGGVTWSSPTIVTDTNGNGMIRQVTLQAGGSTQISIDSGYYSLVYPGGSTCRLWLQDEDGNKSSEVEVSGP